MDDSFFTSRNHFDPQIEAQAWDVTSSTLMVEASARRIAKLSGPIEAAKQLQRVADICAGAYVLPMDHWRRHEDPPPQAPAQLSRHRRLWKAVRANPVLFFWGGFILGLCWEALWR